MYFLSFLSEFVQEVHVWTQAAHGAVREGADGAEETEEEEQEQVRVRPERTAGQT